MGKICKDNVHHKLTSKRNDIHMIECLLLYEMFIYFQLEEERQKQKEKTKRERAKLLDKKRNLGDLLKDAKKRTDEYNRKQAFVQEHSKEYTGGKAVESSLKAYYKEFRKVCSKLLSQ